MHDTLNFHLKYTGIILFFQKTTFECILQYRIVFRISNKYQINTYNQMKPSQSLSSLQTTSYKSSHHPQTMRCFDQTYMNDININLGNSHLSEGEDYVLPVILNYFDAIDIFQITATQMNMQLMQKQQNYATAIVKNSSKVKLVDYLGCLSWWNRQKSNVTALKINIHTNRHFSNQRVKLCRLKILGKRDDQLRNTFITKFKEKMQKADGIYKQPFPFDILTNQQRIQQNETNPFHLQSCAYYILHKIISGVQNQKEGVSHKIKESLKQFHQSFQNIQESSLALPTPMVNAIQISKQIAQVIRNKLLSNKNSSIEYNLMLPYLKIAVEKHIFDKTGKLLKQIYYQNTKNQSQIFQRKATDIKKSMSLQEIFDEVLLPKQLQIVKEQSLLGAQSLSQEAKRKNLLFVGPAYKLINLQNLSSISNIREKVKCCQIMYAELKGFFYEQLNKTYELNSMEDIIPVFIIIVLFCGCNKQDTEQGSTQEGISLRAELNMMIDYINAYGQQFQAQKRLIINLSQSYNFVIRDWKI